MSERADPAGSRSERLALIRSLGSASDSLPFSRHEREQADIRVAIVLVANAYLLIGRAFSLLSPTLSTLYLWMFVGALAFSLVIRASIRLWPRASRLRRITTLIFDYSILTATIAIGAQFAAPIYAILIWVTVGYGMRFGQWYLLAGTAASLASVLVIGLTSPFWRQHPSLVGMLFLTAMIVPLYANLLLRETRRSRDAALAADIAKSRFLAQASHDLRQPIHAISLFTACLREEGLNRAQSQMTDNIDRALDSVSNLFRSLLDVSMLDSGKIEVRPGTVEIGRILKGVAARNGEAARAGGVRIRVVETALRVRTDGALLETMVQNLVSNALKHAPGSDILIGCRRSGGTVGIWVFDQGPGIAPDEQANIFVEFYRIPQPGRDVEGIGLGLSILQRMARLLECSVQLRSTPGHGAGFAITGLRIASATEARHPTEERLGHGAYEPLAGLRVLLVEDNRQVLDATSLLLRRWGCVVQAEPSPDFEPEPVDVVITDFDLDGPVSGVDIVDMVRRNLGADVPALLMTGHDDGRVQQAVMGQDIPVMQKPLRPIELRSSLIVLARRRGDGR